MFQVYCYTLWEYLYVEERHKIKHSMNKKKAQEYLDKINQSFAELDDPAHEIDVESLLGYIRIFYSSVKAIPVQHYGVSGSNQKAVDKETNKKVITSYSENKNTTPVIEDSISEFKPNDTEINHNIEVEKQLEEIPSPWPESESIEIPSETENTFPIDENGDIIANNIDEVIIEEEIKPREYIKTFEEEEKEEIAQIPADERQEIIHEEKHIPVFETQKTEEVKIPEVQPEVIKPVEVVQTYQEIIIEPPVSKADQAAKGNDTFLTKIEAEHTRPLYQPSGHSAHNPSDAIESLFKEKSPTGLVDFLGLSPLDNLNKAWGLNEKMLVIKDLFDDDFASFNDTVEMINKFTSFEEVKYYLINNVVNKFKWNDLSRFKKASDFIVQTKRLFVR